MSTAVCVDPFFPAVQHSLHVSPQERKQAAATLKGEGNSAYAKHEFAAAVELYTRAIQVTPTPEPVFYSNRAACKHYFPQEMRM